ncbi:choline transporter [Bordetella trematum]|uniref:High-affinity choline transport protein n=1 Tax=Bordetella trematum TaxID=123899 RepID=A0A157R3V9_9BORD|nr:choline BCCT transporter BetT [Bordetella trematum]AUL47496.1 choline transporter [Bordetella trematum]AZR94357.1 choline transporter [Bordetella trematum]NNH19895.1 choline BCCT transporter BetT [Bordetella trematum]QIM72903.1 BCCT family transporter [Bordetella trematum]SAI51611.1 high-affinity choline transport protein [Bordetella trematum]
MTQSPRIKIIRPVFFTSGAVILALALFAVLAPATAQSTFTAVQDWIFTNASWFYMLAVGAVLVSMVLVAISRYGDIKLGPDHSQPDYRDPTWYAMLFAAGMGIGLMFFGVAEPVMHFLDPPLGAGGTPEAAREAMSITFFHWGLHAWAIYAVVALILAYFAYRHGLPLTLRSALYPILGDRIFGPIGHAVDIFAIIGTVLGVATSLGLGVTQINAGLNFLFDVPISIPVQVILIVVACGLATLSAASGVDKGIRILSEANMVLAVLLVLFVLLLGPTVFLLQAFVENVGVYLSGIVGRTFNLYAYDQTDWIGGWTLFYWGWWIAWSPFVGVFIARISRGRSIRQFIGGMLLVPSGFTFFWMTVFGDTAIYQILTGSAPGLGDAVRSDSTLALFVFLENFPWTSMLSAFCVLMVLIFFVTSADTGALVVDMLASGVDDAPVWQRVFWSILMGALAIALLLADGLQALQTATIASALPFSVIILVALYGLLKALRLDSAKRRLRYRQTSRGAVRAQPESWQRRIRNMVMMPRRAHVQRFIADVVQPAMADVAEGLGKEGYACRVEEGDDGQLSLHVAHGEHLDFAYSVIPVAVVRPSLTPEEAENEEERRYFRAEVHLGEGGQDYDIMGWSRAEVIGDILDQYERHRHYLHVVS